MWHSGQDGYVWCGIVGRTDMYRDIVGRTGMYHVASWEGLVSIVLHSGEDGYVLCGMLGRTGMYRLA